MEIAVIVILRARSALNSEHHLYELRNQKTRERIAKGWLSVILFVALTNWNTLLQESLSRQEV